MKKQKQTRKCQKHVQCPLTRICLKENCVCQGILCEKCVTEHHKHIKTCMIDHSQEPLSYFSINSSKYKDFDYFSSILASVCQIWQKGNQIIQEQMQKLESTFLFQLNLICKTFALDSAEEVQESLKFKQEDQDSQTAKLNIEVVKCLYKNRQNVQNLDQIKANTERVYGKVVDSLKLTYNELFRNFKKLNQVLESSDIFAIEKKNINIKMTATDLVKINQRHQKQPTKIPQPKQSAQQQGTTPFIIIKKQHKQKENKLISKENKLISKEKRLETSSLVINNQTIDILTKESTIMGAKMIKIEQILSPPIVIEAFLSNSYHIQHLVIESAALATEDNLTILLMCLQRLKTLVLNCKNQVWKCSQTVIHYDSTGKQAPLDRLQYYYDFRRDLETLDSNSFFIKKKANNQFGIAKNTESQLKPSNVWSLERSRISTKATFDMVRRFHLKNMWLSNLNRSQFDSTLDSYDITNIEELTLGHYSHDHTSLPFSLQQKLKAIQNLKSLVLIKTSHFILNLSNFLKKMNTIEVLVFEDLRFQGDQKHLQSFFTNLPKNCPNLMKISISHLQNISIDFIAQLPQLQTLILIKSKKLIFEADCVLKLRHLNLYNAEWNYLKVLRSNKPTYINYLNLGLSTLSFANLITVIQQFSAIQSLCLDKVDLNSDFLDVLLHNSLTLQNLSISGCKTDQNLKIADMLKICRGLRFIDISKCDIEAHILKYYPPQLKYLIKSSQLIIERQLQEQLFTKDINLIELP